MNVNVIMVHPGYRYQDHPNSSEHIFSVKKCQGLLNRIASCVLDDDQLLNLDPTFTGLSIRYYDFHFIQCDHDSFRSKDKYGRIQI